MQPASEGCKKLSACRVNLRFTSARCGAFAIALKLLFAPDALMVLAGISAIRGDPVNRASLFDQ
jgi:hypothetical protein